jgi:NifU-like protein involved in Fe-S cluster formation
MVTQAAASFFSEMVLGKSFNEILLLNEQFMIDNGFDVSHRRRRARVIALLATRNAIHNVLQDGKKDTFDEVLGD